MAKLILRVEGGTGREVSLDEKGSVTIGRSPECDLPIDDTQASRRHCSVVKLQSGYEVADLGSTNGTLLNSTLVKRKKLRHGDVIRIGHAEIVFDDPGSAGAAGGTEIENCFLVYARGERKGQRVELTQQRTTVGRKESNTIVLQDPVASSYHCEIVRDLNGYVIRDLGSTNGTLVNNEMVTEAQLTHGSRIRIGNLRFVFQDPTMAEIDLELAGVDDDESEWAMMRDLDLSAVRRRHPATIAYLVLFLAVLGGGAYLLLVVGPQGPGADKAPQGPAQNLLQHYSFETPAAPFVWDSDPPGAVSVEPTSRVKGEGELALEMRASEAGAEIFYGDSYEARDRRYRLEAKIGGDARIGLLWKGLGLSQWSLADAPGGSGLTAVSLDRTAPPWARGAELGLRFETTGAVYLDDVSLVRMSDPQRSQIEQNNFRLTVTDGRAVDVSHAGAPILAKGEAFARGGDAAGLRVRAEEADPEHILVTVEGASGASVAGVVFEEVRGYLSQGGFRAFGDEPSSGRTYFQAVFPDEGTLELDHVRKLLLGSTGRAFAVLPGSDSDRLQSEAAVEDRRRTWAVFGAPQDGAFSFRLKTDLRGESALASQRISEALNLLQSDRWGDFLEAARRTRAEFPFASKALLDQLGDKIREVEREQSDLEREAEVMLADYDEFKDLQSLDRVAEIIQTLETKFQVAPGEGPRGERLAKLATAEETKRNAALRERQGKLASPILEQALFVHVPEGEVHSAAILFSYIAYYLPASPQAEQARAELAKIEKEHPDVLRVLQGLGIGRE